MNIIEGYEEIIASNRQNAVLKYQFQNSLYNKKQKNRVSRNDLRNSQNNPNM